MTLSTHQCKGMNDTSYWVGFDDEDLGDDEDDDGPDFDSCEGGEVLVEQYSRCQFVAAPDSDFCGKHLFLRDSGFEVKLAKDDDK